MKGKDQLIIFDFDGVLADSFDSFYPLIRDGMKRIGLSITPKQYRELFMGNVHKGFDNFINDEEKLKKFLEFRTYNYDGYYYHDKNKVKLFPEAKEFIEKLDKRYILTIASSGKQKNIKKILKDGGINKFFKLVLADSSYSKDEMIRKIIKKFHANPQKTIMITDTVGDLKIAKEIGLETIAVTWGFHSRKLLKAGGPDHIINSFQKLYRILK